ncbi:FliM/FliN family flagellar motor switch protein [Qingshengfaniella alkalisoli]|nr:flagellar motor switch protein FliM [Qingshengfaniella alkalisoli]
MRRKARHGKAEPESGTVSISQALRQSVLKVAHYLLPVSAEVANQSEYSLSLEQLADQITDFSLVFGLRDGSETKGLIVADRQVLAGLIGAMTTGRIERDELPDRMPTATEAHLTERFFASVVGGTTTILSEHPGIYSAPVLTSGTYVGDLKQIPHLLTDVPYRLAQVDVELGHIRQGMIGLAIPERARPVNRGGVAKPAEMSGTAVIEAALMGSDVPIEAVLHRYHLPIARVAELKPGDSLPLPSRALAHLTLVGSGGEVIATARLGQTCGCRSVKLRAEAVGDEDSRYTDLEIDEASAPSAVLTAVQSD